MLWILYCHLLNIENVQDMFLQIGQKIGKELDINVGRTTVRRARTRVLQEIMGDHIMEYGRIFFIEMKY